MYTDCARFIIALAELSVDFLVELPVINHANTAIVIRINGPFLVKAFVELFNLVVALIDVICIFVLIGALLSFWKDEPQGQRSFRNSTSSGCPLSIGALTLVYNCFGRSYFRNPSHRLKIFLEMVSPILPQIIKAFVRD